MDERFVKVTSDNHLTIVSLPSSADIDSFDSAFNSFVHHEIDCDLYEAVFDLEPFYDNIVMLVDESGFLLPKSINRFASYVHNSWFPIFGDVIFCSTRRVGELQELDFCGLSHEQINILVGTFKRLS